MIPAKESGQLKGSFEFKA